VSSLTLITLLLLLLANPGNAQVSFSGFFDVQYLKPEPDQDLFTGFQYGQFEIDVAADFSHRIRTAGSLVLNTETQEFEPGEGYLSLDFSASQSSFNHDRIIQRTQLLIGQFYVPFGIDHRVISSIDRSLVHAPLINRRTIDSWNSVGAQLITHASEWNATLFVVRSFVQGITAGGRIGLNLTRDMEMGISYAKDVYNAQLPGSNLFGTDLKWLFHHFSLKGEAVFSQGVLNGTTSDQSVYHWGYYSQVKYDILRLRRIPMFLVARYGQWQPRLGIDSQTTPPEKRVTMGGGVRLAYQTEIRVEYMANFRDNRTLTFQFAVGF